MQCLAIAVPLYRGECRMAVTVASAAAAARLSPMISSITVNCAQSRSRVRRKSQYSRK